MPRPSAALPPPKLCVRHWLVLLTLAALLPTQTAHAEDANAPTPSLTPAQVSKLMHTYVEGERLAAIPFGVAGATTLTAGGLLLGNGNDLRRGAAWPLLVGGGIELLAAVILATRTGGHLASLDRLLAERPDEFARLEREHVGRIKNRWQPILLGFEGAMIVGGGTLAIVGNGRHSDTMTGIGWGIAAQGLVLFLLDWAVLDRANAYSAALDQFHPVAQP